MNSSTCTTNLVARYKERVKLFSNFLYECKIDLSSLIYVFYWTLRLRKSDNCCFTMNWNRSLLSPFLKSKAIWVLSVSKCMEGNPPVTTAYAAALPPVTCRTHTSGSSYSLTKVIFLFMQMKYFLISYFFQTKAMNLIFFKILSDTKPSKWEILEHDLFFNLKFQYTSPRCVCLNTGRNSCLFLSFLLFWFFPC